MLQELYEQYKDSFSKSDHKLIQYLLRNEEQLQYITSEELSSHTGISPATVSRFWKKIGFQNLKDLKIKQRIQDTASPSTRLASALKRFEETASITEDLKLHFGNNIEKTPVSYTHLDVYKRQVQSLEQHSVAWEYAPLAV